MCLAWSDSPPPNQPIGLATTSVTYNQIAVQWTNPSDGTITGYQYSTDNVAYTNISGSDQNTTDYTFTSLTASTSYTLYIRAVNVGGESDPASITQTTNQIPAPGAVTNLATTSVSHNEIGVSWTAATGNPTDYEYSTNGSTNTNPNTCLLYTSPSPRDRTRSRMPSSA